MEVLETRKSYVCNVAFRMLVMFNRHLYPQILMQLKSKGPHPCYARGAGLSVTRQSHVWVGAEQPSTIFLHPPLLPSPVLSPILYATSTVRFDDTSWENVCQQPETSSFNPRANIQRICSSWNDGACMFSGSCSHRHICSNCYLPSH